MIDLKIDGKCRIKIAGVEDMDMVKDMVRGRSQVRGRIKG